MINQIPTAISPTNFILMFKLPVRKRGEEDLKEKGVYGSEVNRE